MSPYFLIRRRWVRWAVYLFLLSWGTFAATQFVLQRAWESQRHLARWAEWLIVSAGGLAALSGLFGGLAHDVADSVGHEEKPVDEVDSQAADYDEKRRPD